MENVEPDICLNYLGNNNLKNNKYISYIIDSFNKTNKILNNNNYKLLDNIVLDSSYIIQNLDSLYHYHGTCAMGDVVDNNLKVYNINNLYICDNSVLEKPWPGSTSTIAFSLGYILSKNF